MIDYKILTKLIEDPNITDIKCFGFDQISVKQKDRLVKRVEAQFGSEEAYLQFIRDLMEQFHCSGKEGMYRVIDRETFEFPVKIAFDSPEFWSFMRPLVHIKKLPVRVGATL